MLKKLRPRVLTAEVAKAERALTRYVWSAAWLREAERTAAVSQGITLSQLMVRAGTAAFNVCRAYYPDAQHWLIVAGTGNNGGDGFVMARLARELGVRVTVLAIPLTEGKSLPLEAATAKAALEAAGGAVQTVSEDCMPFPADVDLVVDGLLGTGITGRPRGLYAAIIARVNALPVPRVAIDIPSGLNAETGATGDQGGSSSHTDAAVGTSATSSTRLGAQAADHCFHAHRTVTFISLKPGLLTGRAREYAGEVHYSALGLTEWMSDPERRDDALCYRLSAEDLPRYFHAPRPACAHKGTSGRVLLIGGDVGFGGAILMATEAAVTAGAGLTRVLTPPAHVAPLLTRCPEAMVTPLSDTHLDARSQGIGLDALLDEASTIAVGPGLGRGAFGETAVRAVLRHAATYRDKVYVLDADALNLLPAILERLRGEGFDIPSDLANTVITPHPGEAAQLLGCSVSEIEADRLDAARRLAALLGGTCLLKGPGTVIYQHTPGAGPHHSHCGILDAGNSGMATGGMGDVLTGAIAGVAAQRMSSLFEATCAAALVHSVAADLVVECEAGRGTRGLRATELIPMITHCVNCSYQ